MVAELRGRIESRGAALATALMLAVLILVLGMALLTASQQDLYFQRQQQAKDKADMLARSGIEYSRFLLNQTPPALDSTLPLNTALSFDILAPTEVFILERRQNASTGRIALVVKGLVRKTNGDDFATRTLVVPYGADDILMEAEFSTQIYGQEL